MKIANEIRHGMAEAAESRHQAADDTTYPRRAASTEFAVIGEGFSEAHADAGADRSRETHFKCRDRIHGGEGRGEQRRERRHGTVHQPRKSRLYEAKYK